MSTLDALNDPAAPVVGYPRRDGGQSPAARRILAVAAPRFYLEGIRAVSADAVMAQAEVTKATFYRHFPTKDHLVAAYLTTVSAAERHAVATWRAADPGDPAAVLSRYAGQLAEQACGPRFRGCPFLNALAEYPHPDHPVRVVVDAHRGWLRAVAAELLTELGAADPATAALQLIMLRDGAMTSDATAEEIGRALRTAGAVLVEASRRAAPAGPRRAP
ncbi:MAG: TetR/AcrR family transcriptional regulator [Cellulomonas sp.]|nr:TetR/AcrR family transcriptional regulator [Cellulomonas sp.]